MSKIFTQRWTWLVIVFAMLWLSAEVHYRLLHHRLANLWLTTVAIKTVDDSSGAALPTTVGDMPGLSSDHDYLPQIVLGSSTDGIQRLTIASDEPLTLKISSDGYQEQPLTISRSTFGELTVRLKKK